MSLQAWNGGGGGTNGNVGGGNVVIGGGCCEEDSKRRKMDIKLESEDANFAFPESENHGKVATRNGIVTAGGGRSASNLNGSVGRLVGVTRPRPHMGPIPKRGVPPAHQGPVTLTTQLCKLTNCLVVKCFLQCSQSCGSPFAMRDIWIKLDAMLISAGFFW